MKEEYLIHLGKILSELRRSKGVSGRELASRAGIGQSTISKFENGSINPTEANLLKIAAALKLSADEKTRLVSWRKLLSHPYAPFIPTESHELAAIQRAVNQFEKSAQVIKVYQLLFIPGLVQSPRYIENIFRSTSTIKSEVSAQTIRSAIIERTKRQRILDEPGQRFVFLIHENAFQTISDKAVLKEQIKTLLDLRTRNNVVIGLVPSLQRWIGELTVTSFDLFDNELVLVETYCGLLYLWMESIINDYLNLFEKIHINCVFGDTMEKEFKRILDNFKNP